MAESTEGIACPHCQCLHTDTCDYTDLITYWGEAGRSRFECSECNRTFSVREQVTRTWVTSPLKEESDG